MGSSHLPKLSLRPLCLTERTRLFYFVTEQQRHPGSLCFPLLTDVVFFELSLQSTPPAIPSSCPRLAHGFPFSFFPFPRDRVLHRALHPTYELSLGLARDFAPALFSPFFPNERPEFTGTAPPESSIPPNGYPVCASLLAGLLIVHNVDFLRAGCAESICPVATPPPDFLFWHWVNGRSRVRSLRGEVCPIDFPHFFTTLVPRVIFRHSSFMPPPASS